MVAISPPIVESFENLFVLRDDLLSGGTKRRGLDILLGSLAAENTFYAGTTMGHGALALAHACTDHGKTAHIYVCGENDHPMIQKLRAAGAHLHLQPPMPITDLYDVAKVAAKSETVFPPGFDMPEFEEAIAQSLREFNAAPYPEIWTVSVTGTLTGALKRAFPDKIFKTVSVVKSGAGDFQAPEKYHQAAKTPPPYPACPYTDAKIWQFAREQAAPGALLWNTAG
jgi:hypothetical protein